LSIIENYKDYKKDQKEQKEKEKQYKKDQREKEKQYKKDQREKIKQLKEEQSQKRDDHKKELREKDDDDDDDDDDDYDDDDYKKEQKEKDDDYKKEKKEKDDEKDDDYELGEKFNCKFNGGYYSPEDLPLGQSIVSIGIGECDSVSNPAISYGRLIVSNTLNDNDCYDVVSKEMKIFNGLTSHSTKIYIEITGEQCFQNRNGDKVTPTGICGRGILLTSTVDGKFTITNDAKGSGTFTTTVTNWVDRSGFSYCDSEYPLGSLFQSQFDGSIILN